VRFRKSVGLNASERLLAELCEQSFLKLWTYPNLFRKPGKDLVDLLVVFGNDVIIFSAKACSYPNSGNVAVDWSRWFRSSIAESAKQIAKAENSIQRSSDKVFLDAKCLERLPIALPAAGDMRAHRICVALGALDRAEAETGVNAVLPPLSEDEYPGSQQTVDVPELVDALSNLTISEAVELTAMLREKWDLW
jgi:hypothetical protein